MSSNTDQAARRPKALHTSRSFTRISEPPKSRSTRSRANTVDSNMIPEIMLPRTSEESETVEYRDIFPKEEDEDGIMSPDGTDIPVLKLPERFEDLPIEIRSLTERFLESLSAKVHPTPLTIDALSDLFQDFYIKANAHIASHIALLSSRLSRSNVSSRISLATAKSGSRKESPSDTPGGEMLTASEIHNRKKARRMLELKRVALEETVERAVCEKVYDRIYRHRSAEDEERDQKLRSRTAALSLIGIRLKELLVTTEDVTDDLREQTADNEDLIREWLSEARSSIESMNNERYPLGKLQHLLDAYKHIVETLSRLFPASSSADEILPTLIYALIISSPDTLSVISNANFIQRFRARDRLSGEAQYCLVSLEAATSFLETVDLSSLRSDEAPSGPEKTNTGSRPTTPRRDTAPMRLGISPASDPAVSPLSDSSTPTSKPFPARPQRRLSHLIQTQTNRIEAASDSLRTTVLDASDQAFDSINATLENSFKFLFGRLRETSQSSSAPKTLEDARKFVSTTPPTQDADDIASVSGASRASSILEPEVTPDAEKGQAAVEGKMPIGTPPTDRVLEAMKPQPRDRDRSVDSTRSGGSGKRVSFANGNTNTASSPAAAQPSPSPVGPVAIGGAAVEGIRNLGNNLNPLNRFGGFGVFGRGKETQPQKVPEPAPAVKDVNVDSQKKETVPSAAKEVDPKAAAAMKALEKLRQTKGPSKRFMEVKDIKDLKIGEVEELLRDYQRLANAMRATLAP